VSKFIQGILDSLKLTDEDDFDDDELMVRTRETIRSGENSFAVSKDQQVPPPPKRFEAKPMRSAQISASYEEETYEPKRVIRQERQPVPMRSAANGLEVIIKQPSSFDDAQEICDLLKEEHAIILNLERLDHALAQKMMDFISGAIYALDAKIHQISGYIFCISPAKVDISGDYFSMLTESAGFQIPDLLKK